MWNEGRAYMACTASVRWQDQTRVRRNSPAQILQKVWDRGIGSLGKGIGDVQSIKQIS